MKTKTKTELNWKNKNHVFIFPHAVFLFYTTTTIFLLPIIYYYYGRKKIIIIIIIRRLIHSYIKAFMKYFSLNNFSLRTLYQYDGGEREK